MAFDQALELLRTSGAGARLAQKLEPGVLRDFVSGDGAEFVRTLEAQYRPTQPRLSGELRGLPSMGHSPRLDALDHPIAIAGKHVRGALYDYVLVTSDDALWQNTTKGKRLVRLSENCADWLAESLAAASLEDRGS